MSKHTPGPWTVSEYTNDEYGSRDVLTVAKDELGTSSVVAEYIATFNADLIAASPDLLEVCELVLMYATVETPETVLIAARAALKKAKGN